MAGKIIFTLCVLMALWATNRSAASHTSGKTDAIMCDHLECPNRTWRCEVARRKLNITNMVEHHSICFSKHGRILAESKLRMMEKRTKAIEMKFDCTDLSRDEHKHERYTEFLEQMAESNDIKVMLHRLKMKARRKCLKKLKSAQQTKHRSMKQGRRPWHKKNGKDPEVFDTAHVYREAGPTPAEYIVYDSGEPNHDMVDHELPYDRANCPRADYIIYNNGVPFLISPSTSDPTSEEYPQQPNNATSNADEPIGIFYIFNDDAGYFSPKQAGNSAQCDFGPKAAELAKAISSNIYKVFKKPLKM